MPSLHDTAWLETRARTLRIDHDELRLFRNAFYKHQRTGAEALREIDPGKRSAFAEGLSFHTLRLERRSDSAIDGASKLVFRTERGFLIESVILRFEKGRTALCVSSQVGCAAGCVFCATGQMGIARSLSTAEIVDQLALAEREIAGEGRRIRNVVFMGMGEPLHNEEAVLDAVELLLSPAAFYRSPRHVVVSTVGVPDAMRRLAARFPGLQLAVSVHSALDEVRARIVPIARQHSLAEIRAALVDIAASREGTFFIEYLLLDGVNDRDEDLDALASYLEGLPVHVNLIPYNPIAAPPIAGGLSGTPRERREAFGAELRARGFVVTLRHSLGADIDAACGQLVREENRALAGLAPRA